jgi:hypothetical protein
VADGGIGLEVQYFLCDVIEVREAQHTVEIRKRTIGWEMQGFLNSIETSNLRDRSQTSGLPRIWCVEEWRGCQYLL